MVGVTDDGEVAGLMCDYQTLKHSDRDGFERCIPDIVTTRLGAHLGSLTHFAFYDGAGKDVCRIIVEPASEPVYLQDGNTAKYYLRIGHGTRELDAREALALVARK